MNQIDTIRRLCALVTDVGIDVFANAKAHDCFCGRQHPRSTPTVHSDVLTFIEEAVREKIARENLARERERQ